MKEGYISKEQRKTILLICDDVKSASGVASIMREVVIGTSHHFNWIQIAVAKEHPDNKIIDLSEDTNKHAKITDSLVIQYPCNSYFNMQLIRNIISDKKIDAVMLVTDPHYFAPLWVIMEHEIRTKIPIIYYNIWDNTPYPHYNKNFYKSCDALLCISKQTENIVKQVLGNEIQDKIISYIPHGINDEFFYPINESHDEYIALQALKQQIFEGKEYNFIGIVNNRNIRRKCIPDILISWKMFIDKLPTNNAKKCCLLLKTNVIDSNGTDLKAVCEMLFNYDIEEKYNVKIIDQPLSVKSINLLYNIADFGISLSCAEGWGLGITETLMVGKPIIANVTGGLQDQMRFEDNDGKWIEFSKDFSTNSIGKFKKCGDWAFPVFSSARTLMGSPSTPYIFEDHIDYKDVVTQFSKLLEIKNNEPKKYNDICNKARKWVISDESKMSSIKMCTSMIEQIDMLFKTWKPKEKYSLTNIQPLQSSKHYNNNNI